MENPDGTIVEAVPSTYKVPRSRLKRSLNESPSTEDDEVSDDSNAVAAAMFYDVEYLYNQHARAMTILLICHFLATLLYNIVFFTHVSDGSSVKEFMEMYGWDNATIAKNVLWVAFVIEVTFAVAFYVVAIASLWTQRPSWFRQLASYGIGGVVGYVMLAYIDKFNLVVFFLHLLTYIYAKFMQGLTSSLMLLPSPQPRQQVRAQGRNLGA